MLIKKFKLFNFTIMRISYDGIHDQYWLFDKYKIFQKENDRDFWNDWEQLLMKRLAHKMKIFYKQIFSINNFDNHLSIYFCGLRIRKKLKPIVKKIEIIESGLNQIERKP